MQLVSPSEYIRIVGSALLVQRSPLALGMPFRASGFFRQLLEMQLVCRISPLVNFHPASEYNSKAAGSRTITPTCAPEHLSPDEQSNRSSSSLPGEKRIDTQETSADCVRILSCPIRTGPLLPFRFGAEAPPWAGMRFPANVVSPVW